MNISLISFTQHGTLVCFETMEALRKDGHICSGYAKGNFEAAGDILQITGSLKEWTGERFDNADALIFIGATGIAVRAIAPFAKSKKTDPACIVIDEQGKFVIPLLSGHIGGANELARRIAERTGALPVITTATDLNGLFAVDEWANKNNMHISNMKLAKKVASELLQKKNVSLESSFEINGRLPEGLVWRREITAENECNVGIDISVSAEEPAENVLKLIPRQVVLGIGCRRNTPFEIIEQEVEAALKEAGISGEAVCRIASIDLKKDEQGLIEFAGKAGVPFETFTSEELSAVPGDFSTSSFVSSVTGVDNVCERSAVLTSRCGELIMKKRANNGVTVAAALKKISFQF